MSVAEKKVSVGQRPAILWMIAGIFPFDRTVGGNFSHFSTIGIGAEERMGTVKKHRQRQQSGDTKQSGRGIAHRRSLMGLSGGRTSNFPRCVFGLARDWTHTLYLRVLWDANGFMQNARLLTSKKARQSVNW